MTTQDIFKKLGLAQEQLGRLSFIGQLDPTARMRGWWSHAIPPRGIFWRASTAARSRTTRHWWLALRRHRPHGGLVPAPKRGEIIRLIGQALRENKDALGTLVSLEVGKIKSEGDGEVQEMIDMADFAVGLSRMLYGQTMHSERARHRMYEQWHPLGVVGVITAFNFPVAVWAWNAFIAAVAGNTVLWKPSPKAPLCGLAVQHLCNRVLDAAGYPGVFASFTTDRIEVAEQHGPGRTVAADLVHGIGSGREACGRSGRPSAGAKPPGVEREQCDYRGRDSRPRIGDQGDCLRRSRHGGAALHKYPAAHRARVAVCEADAAPSGCLCAGYDW